MNEYPVFREFEFEEDALQLIKKLEENNIPARLEKNKPLIDKMIIGNSTAKDIKDQARQEGLITMKQDGYLKALNHVTTLEEILRVAESE